jgi:excisionase family DNA binding protein
MTRLIRYQEAADLLGVSRRTLGKAIAAGELSPIQAPGTKGTSGRRLSLVEVEALMQAPEPIKPPKSPLETKAMRPGGPVQMSSIIRSSLKRVAAHKRLQGRVV